jgi:aspartate aminotransferase
MPNRHPRNQGGGRLPDNPDLLKKYLTPRTKAIILNYPSNPVGSVFYHENLEAIGKLAVEKGFYLISDEIYEKLVYDYKHVSIASMDPAFKERTIICHGVSKTYAMTGWRIGYSAGPAPIIKAMGNIQSLSTSNPTSVSQMAALSALSPAIRTSSAPWSRVQEEKRLSR